MVKKYLPFYVLLLIMLPIVYFILTLSTPATFNVSDSDLSFDVCQNGQEKPCTTSEGCEGTSYCMDNEWGNCVVAKVCIPGTKVECGIGCSFGYQECNECGTGFTSCELP